MDRRNISSTDEADMKALKRLALFIIVLVALPLIFSFIMFIVQQNKALTHDLCHHNYCEVPDSTIR